MEFLPDGHLHYHVDVGGSDQVIALLYGVEGDMLRTDNPAAPHSMSVRITHGVGDVLLMDFGGAQAMLLREQVGDRAREQTPGEMREPGERQEPER